MTWINVASAGSGSPPSPRIGHRVISMRSKLYLQGGFDISGESVRQREGEGEGVIERGRERERGRGREGERGRE